MEPASLPPPVSVGTMLGGRLDAIRHMKGERGRVAAARELQVILFSQLIEAMRRTLPENSFLPRSPARDVYDGLFDRELAKVMVANDPLRLVASLGHGEGNESGARTGGNDGRPAGSDTETRSPAGGSRALLASSLLQPSLQPRRSLAEDSRNPAEAAVAPVEEVVRLSYGPRGDLVAGSYTKQREAYLGEPAGMPAGEPAMGRPVQSAGE